MIFVSGIHGVGKDYFSKRMEKILGIKAYSASELIEKYGNLNFNSNKRTTNINDNQHCLIQAIKSGNLPREYILNGHFCLLNSNGEVEKIPINTFYQLKPSKIIILKEKPEIIVGRRIIRDKEETSVEKTRIFQKEEITYGKDVARKLGIPVGVFDAINDFEKAAFFISHEIDKSKVIEEIL